MTVDSSDESLAIQRRATQTVIRLSVLALLVFLCFRILSPFINPIIGGLVIAIALQTPHAKLTRAIAGDAQRQSAPAAAASQAIVLLQPPAGDG